jgi:hypothetical protein
LRLPDVVQIRSVDEHAQLSEHLLEEQPDCRERHTVVSEGIRFKPLSPGVEQPDHEPSDFIIFHPAEHCKRMARRQRHIFKTPCSRIRGRGRSHRQRSPTGSRRHVASSSTPLFVDANG